MENIFVKNGFKRLIRHPNKKKRLSHIFLSLEKNEKKLSHFLVK